MINLVVISGNLTKDPELKYLGSGTAVCSFTLALNNKYKNSSGEIIEEVSYIDVVAFGKSAENCTENLHKGSRATIQGRLKQERWEDKNGGGQRSRVRVMASLIEYEKNKQSLKQADD